VIELEKSGIRDGDSFWHGSDVMGGVTGELGSIIDQYMKLTNEVWKGGSGGSEGGPSRASRQAVRRCHTVLTT
jgi:hypothetical protein